VRHRWRWVKENAVFDATDLPNDRRGGKIARLPRSRSRKRVTRLDMRPSWRCAYEHAETARLSRPSCSTNHECNHHRGCAVRRAVRDGSRPSLLRRRALHTGRRSAPPDAESEANRSRGGAALPNPRAARGKGPGAPRQLVRQERRLPWARSACRAAARRASRRRARAPSSNPPFSARAPPGCSSLRRFRHSRPPACRADGGRAASPCGPPRREACVQRHVPGADRPDSFAPFARRR
jgi:hypothetical protein